MRTGSIGSHEGVAAVDDHLGRVDTLLSECTRVALLTTRCPSRTVRVRPAEAIPVVDVKGEWIDLLPRSRGLLGQLSQDVVRGGTARATLRREELDDCKASTIGVRSLVLGRRRRCVRP